MSDTNERFEHTISETIRAHAMTFPETVEGASCVNRAFKAGGKNFVFLGEKTDECNIRLKLAASIPEIEALAEHDPDHWQVGKGGWAMLRFAPDHPPPVADLERWITESFHLLAPKKVIALLDI
jgi:hypothetical protein